jgi:hypothetical protein
MAISDIQHKGSLYALLDGRKVIKQMHQSAVGDLCGFSSDLIVFKKGSLFGIYDESGKIIKQLHQSAVGDFRGVVGPNILFNRGSLVETYDSTGKKINSRHK